jgi:uncharacterized protein
VFKGFLPLFVIKQFRGEMKMGDLPCKGCKGLCCGPVPISERELRQIKKDINKMPAKRRHSLKNQQRFLGTCIFFDEANDCCGIHSVRPAICRAFGHHQNLVCFRKPEAASAKTYYPNEEAVGTLSIDFTWNDFG